MEKELNIVSHSHWDREWYLSTAKHNYRLVEFMDRLLKVLDEDPEFRSFHLDGQIGVITDYLSFRPENREKIVKYIAEGRIKAGPNYILQDEYLVSGEATVRNLIVGKKETAKYGKPTEIGYFPDAFGNIGQMPQILQGFGIDCAFYGRAKGNPDLSRISSEVRWTSPDGSEVMGVCFCNWYSNAMEIPATDPKTSADYMKLIMKNAEPFARTPYLLGLNGCDHEPVQADLSKAIRHATEEGVRVVHTSFEDYAAKIRPYKESFPVEYGELESQESDGNCTLINTASARIYLKQSSDKAEYLLTSIAEPLACILEKNSIAPYDSDVLYWCWKRLLDNYPHDSICGCSVDEVHRKMEVRFMDAIDTTESLIESMGRKLVAHAAHENKSAVVVNTANKDNSGYVTFTVDYREDETIPSAIGVFDGEKEIPSFVKDLGITDKFILPEDKFRQVFKVHRYVIRAFVKTDALSVKVLDIRETKGNVKADIACGADFMENRFVKVAFSKNGTFTLTNKKTAKSLVNQNYFTECGDKGDEYFFRPEGMPHDTLDDVAEITHETENDRVVFTILNHLMTRDGKPVVIKSVLTLGAEDRAVDIVTSFDNQVKNHRIRACFGFEGGKDYHRSSGQFDLTTRPNQPNDHWKNPDNSHRCYEFVNRLSEDNNEILVVHGNYEYEVNRENSATELTLVRGVDRMGDWFYFPTKDSQCLGEITAHYQVLAYGDTEEKEAVCLAYEHNKPHLVAFAGEGEGKPIRPLDLHFHTNLPQTALKKAENGLGYVVRFFNPFEKEERIPTKNPVTVINLCECEPVADTNDIIVGKKKIITVKVGE